MTIIDAAAKIGDTAERRLGDLEVRYRLDEDGYWYAVAWRVMEGRWHRCNALSKQSRKILGHFRWFQHRGD